MDPVGTGLIAGITVSLLIALGGTITFVSEKYLPYIQGAPLFLWLILLTTLMFGQFVFTFIIMDVWDKTPQQNSSGTVI
jgi:hypothetical protein